MPAVSIIIPVYNAEKSIGRCIDSILTQEFEDFELILINDGSKDSSGEILDEYAAKDARVRVIHKPNSGVSATRNLGLKEAKGKYIQFLDADDWMTTDSTKILYRAMEEDACDMVVAGFYRVVGELVARKSSIETDRILTLQEYSELMMDNPADYYYGVLWNKLYRADLIRQYNIHMDESLSFCEDFVFNLDYLVHTEKIRALNVPVYYYVKTEGGLVSKNMNPVRLVQMKLSVFSYYSKFFKDVLDEKQYQADRASIAGFLIAAAGDDMVVPMMPGTRKIGEETVSVSLETRTDSPLLNTYYERKLFERYLNTIAMKYDISLRDAVVCAVIHVSGHIRFAGDIADFMGISQLSAMGIFEKLQLKKLISPKYAEGSDLPVMEVINPHLIKDIDQASADYRALITKGMSEEDVVQLKRLAGIYGKNIREALKVNSEPKTE